MKRPEHPPLGEFRAHPVPNAARRHRHLASYFANNGASPAAVELTRGLRQTFRLRILNAKS